MKSFFGLSIKLGLIGSVLIGSAFIGTLQALALSQEQVLEKLMPVPVFTITDAQGAPLVSSPSGQGNSQRAVTGVFISQKDAQNFVDTLKKDNPNLGNAVQVVPVSLGEIYKMNQENKSKPDGLGFAFVPVSQQVQEAQRILNSQEFRGVPLFVATAGKDNGYLTIENNGKQFIPFFFEKEQLQVILDNFKKQQPSLSSTVQIQVVSLEGVIKTLTEKNDQGLNNVVLLPTIEAQEFLRSLRQNNSNNNQQPRR